MLILFVYLFLVTLDSADEIMDEAIEGKVFEFLTKSFLQNQLLYKEVTTHVFQEETL